MEGFCSERALNYAIYQCNKLKTNNNIVESDWQLAAMLYNSIYFYVDSRFYFARAPTPPCDSWYSRYSDTRCYAGWQQREDGGSADVG